MQTFYAWSFLCNPYATRALFSVAQWLSFGALISRLCIWIRTTSRHKYRREALPPRDVRASLKISSSLLRFWGCLFPIGFGTGWEAKSKRAQSLTKSNKASIVYIKQNIKEGQKFCFASALCFVSNVIWRRSKMEADVRQRQNVEQAYILEYAGAQIYRGTQTHANHIHTEGLLEGSTEPVAWHVNNRRRRGLGAPSTYRH